MRGRQDGERSAVRLAVWLHDREPVARAKAHRFLVHAAPESVLLPGARGVAPDHTSIGGDAEPFQPAYIFIGYRGFVGCGDRFLPQEVGSAINRILQAPRENARVQSGKRNFDPRSVGLHLAAPCLVPGLGLPERTSTRLNSS